MYTSIISVLAFTASALAGQIDYPDCWPAASSCSKLPAKSTASCWSIISKAKINVATCEVPSSTVTSTVTVAPKPKKTITAWASATTTLTTTENVNATFYSTSVTTAVYTVAQTLTESATSTLTTTQNVNITSTAYTTITNTTTLTSTKDQTKETCAPKKRDNFGKRGFQLLPSDCSCFLASTTTQGLGITTTTLTVTPTITQTVTIPVTVTVTSTWSITIPVTSTASSQTISLTTTTTTLNVTETDTATWTLSTTLTSSSTVTTTTTTTINPCAAAATVSAIPNGGVAVQAGSPFAASQFTDCCSKCFGQANCVFYEFGKGKCTLFTNTKKSTCLTDSCPNGKQDLTLKKPSGGDVYGYGPCVGSVPSTW